jgi:uroporphyrin-III C-methyltransferase / precorrin-2 dehydrogenase / sirohydrochlorin ferrochelatase
MSIWTRISITTSAPLASARNPAMTPPMHSLPVFLRLRGRPVMLVGSGDAADAKRRLLERAGATIVGEDGQAALAIVALADEGEAQAVAARLKERGLLVNVVDQPALCDFTLPAILDRDPVLIAIGTGGASAGLAKALRQRLEALLPQSLGALAQALSGARGQTGQRAGGQLMRRLTGMARLIPSAAFTTRRLPPGWRLPMRRRPRGCAPF